MNESMPRLVSQARRDPGGYMSSAAQDAAASAEPTVDWRGAADAWTLHLSGNWRGQAQPIPAPPDDLRQGRLDIDAAGLTQWDARLAAALWQRLSALDRSRLEFDLSGLPQGLQQILTLSLPPPLSKGPMAARAAVSTPPGELDRVGLAAQAWVARGAVSLEFIGQVLLSFGRLLRGASQMQRADFWWQVQEVGPRSLPIVSLVSMLIGLIVAYMGAAQLEQFGARSFIADLVTVGVVREIAALAAGIILAGRVGAAFAAQIGSMRANEEIDALQTLGVDPVDNLVLPRVLAMLLMAPLLTAYAAIVGLAVGWLVAVTIYDVAPLDYLVRSLHALTPGHVAVGLIKGTVYATLVALAGCRQGLSAGRSAQAVGEATTSAVVQSIVWMAVAASLLTVVFQRLDW
jgi:phospholipid/cholesterol/gamma-HCH transport system permease protein